MFWNNKVIWSEGMLLQPQHLQQQDRYLHSLLEARCRALGGYSWGFSRLLIDEQQLGLGKLALLACEGVMPDGTPLSLPLNDDLPLPLDIPADMRDTQIVLALPLRRPGVPEVGANLHADAYARYQGAECEVHDSNEGADDSALMRVGRLRLRLAPAEQVANAYATLGVARVVERRDDNRLVLDPAYSPPCLDYRVAPRLAAFVDELAGLLHQRGDALAARLAQPGVTGTGEIADFLLLQLINRAEPLFTHFSACSGLHPEQLYRAVVQLAGELASFSQASKRSSRYPAYQHDALQQSFQPLMAELRHSLSMVMDPLAVPIALEKRKFGLSVAVLPDPSLFNTASFVLAVHADLPVEAIWSSFPAQVKIGPVEKIRDLVNLQLPGVGLRGLPVAPRQLPFHAGYSYFALDNSHELWAQLAGSAGIALHVAGEFPGLDMELWAIRR
ncbi:type VI secretion system baseplate subunit TssK [Chitinimonas arctica]|uniref:Type VI secretion system baseplate subunit TssK n=1 Tax=Chitinimonas arctica TaxID=2594795 RepID=A0A516SBB0_9NEIS|nr:type VI secretion system baseplate subunit TssK [Chitinimonas arctica]QDQ25434.1 type VI secretion system baseplate subunit TssK [Chitinimonas arctica]